MEEQASSSIDDQKALVVGGSSKFAEFFRRRFPEVYHAETIDEVYEKLSSGEIPNTCGVVIINSTSTSVNDGRGRMEYLIAQFAPFACVCVLALSDEPKARIKSEVVKKVLTENFTEAPFYFIGKESALGAVENSLRSWKEWFETNLLVQNESTKREPSPIRKRKGSRIITVTSAKGGAGKSTTAVLLASQIALSTAAAGNPKKVCVIDMDVYDGQLGFMIMRSDPTVINLIPDLTGNDEIDFAPSRVQSIAVKKVLKKRGGATSADVDFYLAAKMGIASYAAPDSFYYKLILSLTQVYDFVIMDTSVSYINDPRIRNVCYALADSICYMTTLIVQSKLDMTRWFKYVASPKEIGGMEIPLRKIGIVINHAPSNIGEKLNEVKQAANPKWSGEGESGINIIGAIPDAPQRVFTEAGNDFELERLLYDDKYGIGASFYQLAHNVVPPDVKLRPLVDMSKAKRAQQRPVQTQRVQQQAVEHEEPKQEEEKPKKGFFARLLGK